MMMVGRELARTFHGIFISSIVIMCVEKKKRDFNAKAYWDPRFLYTGRQAFVFSVFNAQNRYKNSIQADTEQIAIKLQCRREARTQKNHHINGTATAKNVQSY